MVTRALRRYVACREITELLKQKKVRPGRRSCAEAIFGNLRGIQSAVKRANAAVLQIAAPALPQKAAV